MPADPGSWIEILREMLCRMYEAWGGDCQDLKLDPAERIAQVAGMYAQHGPPTFESREDTEAFLELLLEVEAHLALPENSLEAPAQLELTTLISQLQSGLGE
jgi:hypothetical protein